VHPGGDENGDGRTRNTGRLQGLEQGGRMIWLGTGRVISEMTTQALARPRAICASGGL
jgi:hypothetical protein